jgi:hypothetical protein
MMSIFDDADVISAYPLEQAIEDGVLVAIFKNRWQELSGGKPIVATAHLFNDISLAGLLEIWNEFVQWQKHVMPTLPEAERLFHTTMNGKKVWVIEDGAHLPSCIQRITRVSAVCSPRSAGWVGAGTVKKLNVKGGEKPCDQSIKSFCLAT